MSPGQTDTTNHTIVHNKTHNKKARMKGKSTSPHPVKNSKKA